MSRELALKQATRAKSIHEAAKQRKKDRAEEALRQWEWDHFEPMVYGQPCPGTTTEEYEKMIDDARRSHRNIMFGGYCPEVRETDQRTPNFIDSVLSFIGL